MIFHFSERLFDLEGKPRDNLHHLANSFSDAHPYLSSFSNDLFFVSITKKIFVHFSFDF